MKKYLKIYFSFFIAILSILSGPALYLYAVGEYTDLQEVIEKQNISRGKVLYGTALFENTHLYKKVLLSNAQPQIVVLGSSRVMQIRQRVFVEKMINLGGAMSSINEGLTLLPLILEKHPKIVLIGLDVWWFNGKYQKPVQPYIEKDDVTFTFNLKHSCQVFEWLYKKKLSIKNIFNTIRFGAEDFGVAGNEKNGFAKDGSYYSTNLITGRSKSLDWQFSNTLQRIQNGSDRFRYGTKADDQHITNFIKLVRSLENNGTEVVLFFPPFAKPVNEKIRVSGSKYSYISNLKRKLSEKGVDFYDYSNPTSIHSDVCEFIDGFHGGELTYLRILRELSARIRSFGEQLNKPLLEEVISGYAGKAFVADAQITSDREVDYLGLGCDKK